MTVCFSADFNQSYCCNASAAVRTSMPEITCLDTVIAAVSIILVQLVLRLALCV